MDDSPIHPSKHKKRSHIIDLNSSHEQDPNESTDKMDCCSAKFGDDPENLIEEVSEPDTISNEMDNANDNAASVEYVNSNPTVDTESVNSDVNSTSSDEPMNHKEVDKKYKRRVLQNSRYT